MDANITKLIKGIREWCNGLFVQKEDGKGLFSGSYSDLSDKPTIPSTTSELTNNSGYITSGATNLENYYTKNEIDIVEEVIDDKIVDICNELGAKQDKLTNSITLTKTDGTTVTLTAEDLETILSLL